MYILDNFLCHAGGYNRVLIKMILFFLKKEHGNGGDVYQQAESCLSFLHLMMDSVSKLGTSRVGKLNVYLAMVCSSI